MEELSSYDYIVGSGGFGLIIGSKNKKAVMKLLYDQKSCEKSEFEFLTHKEIYKSLYPLLLNGTIVSKPINFINVPLTIMGKNFLCSYKMDLILPLFDNDLYHIILKEDYGGLFNRRIGRVSSQPISSENPPRGFFAVGSYISQNIIPTIPISEKIYIKSINDISYRMGYLFGLIVFKAEFLPTDVEYVLCRDNIKNICVAVLDFGMATKITFDPDYIFHEHLNTKLNVVVNNIINICELDLYFPYPDDPLYPDFISGFDQAFMISISGETNQNIKQNKTYVHDNFIANYK